MFIQAIFSFYKLNGFVENIPIRDTSKEVLNNYFAFNFFQSISIYLKEKTVHNSTIKKYLPAHAHLIPPLNLNTTRAEYGTKNNHAQRIVEMNRKVVSPTPLRAAEKMI